MATSASFYGVEGAQGPQRKYKSRSYRWKCKKVREAMTESPISKEEVRKIDDYLKAYQLNRRLLRLDRYEREYLGYRETVDEVMGDGALARAKMYEIRHFIMEMANSDEKLLLYYHYIRGESVEKCGELLGISRASAFRLKKKALELASIKRALAI